jgi:hypothetical protein
MGEYRHHDGPALKRPALVLLLTDREGDERNRGGHEKEEHIHRTFLDAMPSPGQLSEAPSDARMRSAGWWEVSCQAKWLRRSTLLLTARNRANRQWHQLTSRNCHLEQLCWPEVIPTIKTAEGDPYRAKSITTDCQDRDLIVGAPVSWA